MQVPLLDLKAQYVQFRDELFPKVQEVLDSQLVCNGPAVGELESIIAQASDCAEGIGVSSGTDALLISLMALGIGEGDEVITTPFTFFATAGSIWRVGAKPVFADIEPDTFNIDPSKIEAAITDKTRAIMPVHLYGQCAEMDAILAIAEKHNLYVIEDCAQSIQAEYKGRKACSMGTVGCLSFYPTKNLGAMGDAGMVLTNDQQLAEKIRMFRNHGQGGTYIHKWVGGNFRMDTLCAAGLVVKHKHLEKWTQGRRGHADMFNEMLADCPGVKTPVIREYNRSIYNQYVIRAKNRDELRKHLVDNQIGCGIYYPLGLHMQECFASLGYKEGDFPLTEQACREVLALPVFAEMTDQQVRYVADKIKEFYK